MSTRVETTCPCGALLKVESIMESFCKTALAEFAEAHEGHVAPFVPPIPTMPVYDGGYTTPYILPFTTCMGDSVVSRAAERNTYNGTSA